MSEEENSKNNPESTEENDEWDAEDIYDDKFSPLIEQLIELAEEHDLPLHITVQFANKNNKARSCTTHMPGTRCGDQFDALAHVSIGKQQAVEVILRSIASTVIPVVLGSEVPDAMNGIEHDEDGFPVRK